MICRPPPSGIHNTGGSPQPSEAEAAMAIGGALPEKNAILEKKEIPFVLLLNTSTLSQCEPSLPISRMIRFISPAPSIQVVPYVHQNH